MEQYVMFGAGVIGERAYFKFKEQIHIIGFSDNDEKLHGQMLRGLPIIPPSKLPKLENLNIIISSWCYKEIGQQLIKMKFEINRIFVVDPNSYQLVYFEHSATSEIPLFLHNTHKKFVKKVLFVQAVACMRTKRIAQVLKNHGIEVDLAYQIEHPDFQSGHSLRNLFSKILSINTFHDFLSYVNDENYDIIHCSNEPDALTNIILCSNKKVVHDTHDLMSLAYDNINNDQQALEFIANFKSNGNVYTSQGVREYAVNKYGIEFARTMVVENYILESLRPKRYLPKLSLKSGEIHCVYVGGIVSDPKSYKFMEKYWNKITEARVHIHFYTASDAAYCERISEKNSYLHYEGFLEPDDLVTAMTQYDCGLVSLIVTPSNRFFLEHASPNKIYDYLNAGLPITVSDLVSQKAFVEKHKVGAFLDLGGDVKKQISEVAAIQIDKDFLSKNKLTMDAKAEALIEFYNRILNN